MRVVEQLINHLRASGHLTPEQLAELRRMGLLKNEPVYHDHPGPDVDVIDDDDRRTDALDAYGDRLIDDARRTSVRRRKGGGKRLAAHPSSFLAAVAAAVAALGGFVDVAVEVAQRLGVNGDADAALSAVVSADAARLDAALVRDSLWARLWPQIQREPVFEALAENERRRFSALVEAASRRDTTLPRRLTDHPALRRAIDIVAAHRVLSSAFGRAPDAVGPRRALLELDLAGNPAAYEVLVLLHSAHTTWRTVAELPDLVSDLGLPAPARLRRPCFESGWEIAARIDPLKVLPLMDWCNQAWKAMPAEPWPTALGMNIGLDYYTGDWVSPPVGDWFGLKFVPPRWAVVRCSRHYSRRPGGVSQTLSLDGIDYSHVCADVSCKSLRTFQRADRPETLSVRPVTGLVPQIDADTVRADYGALWAARLIEMPLLTCPKEWERT